MPRIDGWVNVQAEGEASGTLHCWRLGLVSEAWGCWGVRRRRMTQPAFKEHSFISKKTLSQSPCKNSQYSDCNVLIENGEISHASSTKSSR
jgi:hypothetical protein